MNSDCAPRRRASAECVGPYPWPPASPQRSAPRRRVAIISRHRLYRDALVAALPHVPNLHFTDVLTPEDAAETGAVLDIAVVDARLGAEGAALVERLCSRMPGLRTIVLGAAAGEGAPDWAEARGSTYVDADGSAADIIVAVLRAARAESEPPGGLARLPPADLVPVPAAPRAGGPRASQLTPRERAVLQMAAEGLANKEIARCLQISACTVKNHMHNVLDKLGARRRGEAVARFRRELETPADFGMARLQPSACA